MPRVARGLGLTAAVLAGVLVAGCSSGDDTTSAPPGSASARTSLSATASTDPTAGTSTSASSASGERYALFFGDSNFVGGGCTPDAQQDMARIAGDRLGYGAVIRGEGGTGFATGNVQYGLADYIGQVQQGALDFSPAPQLVVIEGGSNDTADQLGNAERNAERILQIAKSKYPDALVVLMGPIDVRAGHGDVLPRIVPLLQQAADRVGVPFLNAYDWLPWRTTPGLVCTSDYDHATLAGHQILGTTLATQLAQLGA